MLGLYTVFDIDETNATARRKEVERNSVLGNGREDGVRSKSAGFGPK